MKHAKLYFFLALYLAASFHLNAQSTENAVAGVSIDRLERFDNFIKSEIQEGNIPGGTSLIFRNGEVIHKSVFGYRNIADKTPMEVDDIFFIQSMTKPIITVAFMMLYEEGHFMLTDPVSKYLPEFKNLKVSKNVDNGVAGETEPLEQEITIAHLLSHTSGLTHGLGSSQLDQEFMKEYFMQEWPDIESRVNNIPKLPLMGQPGNQWYYSVAPDILSLLIEQFSGMSTQEFLKAKLFIPLGMKNTEYNLTKKQQSRVVTVYSKNEDDLLVESRYQPKMSGNTIWSGVNGLYSTTSDYMTFCEMLLNNGKLKGQQFLSRKTIKLMTDNHVGELYYQPGEGFGYGFAVLMNVTESNLLGSNGLYYWAGAYNTHFFIDPEENLIAIFMTQTNPYTNLYHDKMRQLVYQAIID